MYFYDILFSFDFAALSPAPVGRKQHFELSVFVAFFSISSLSPSLRVTFSMIFEQRLPIGPHDHKNRCSSLVVSEGTVRRDRIR